MFIPRCHRACGPPSLQDLITSSPRCPVVPLPTHGSPSLSRFLAAPFSASPRRRIARLDSALLVLLVPSHKSFRGSRERKSHPVSQPLLVIVGRGALDSLDRQVSGQSPADEVGDGRGEAKHVEKDQYDRAVSSVYGLGLISAFLACPASSSPAPGATIQPVPAYEHAPITALHSGPHKQLCRPWTRTRVIKIRTRHRDRGHRTPWEPWSWLRDHGGWGTC